MCDTSQAYDQLLFSYGTLQLPAVQLATFGRLLAGSADQLPGFRLDMLEITDPQVLATSGQRHHPIVSHSGLAQDQVAGMALQVSLQELQQADGYEVADYQRQLLPLASGRMAWVYVAVADGQR